MTATIGRTTGAEARLPDESAILPLAARENFSVASLLARARDTRPPARRSTDSPASSISSATRSPAIGSRCSTCSSERSAASSTASRSTRCCDDSRARCASCRLPARAVPAPDRSQPPRPDDIALRHLRGAAGVLRPVGQSRSASSCCTSSAPRQPIGSRSRTTSARPSSSSSTGRTSPRTSPGPRLPTRPRISTLRRAHRRPRRRRRRRRSSGASLEFEVDRARRLLEEGAPLIRRLRGRARIAVAGYVAGGRAALDAIAAADFDVLGAPPRASRARRLRATLRAYAVGK